MLKLENVNNGLALVCVFCVSLCLAGCNPSAEVPTAGDGPNQSSSEHSPENGKESGTDDDAESTEQEELTDDYSEDEAGSILE